MALVFPRDLPYHDFRDVKFHLASGSLSSANGRLATRVVEPFWTAQFTVDPLTEREMMDWQAFFLSLRGALRTFLAWHPRHSVPFSVRDGLPLVGGNPWTGSATLSTVADRTVLALASLPVGLVLMANDRIAVTQTISGQVVRGYHAVTEGAVADGSGAATVAIEPALDERFTVAASLSLVRPRLHLRLDGDVDSIASSVGQEGFTFSATEAG